MIQRVGKGRQAGGRAFDSGGVRLHIQEVDDKLAGGGFCHPVARHPHVASGCKGATWHVTECERASEGMGWIAEDGATGRRTQAHPGQGNSWWLGWCEGSPSKVARLLLLDSKLQLVSVVSCHAKGVPVLVSTDELCGCASAEG